MTDARGTAALPGPAPVREPLREADPPGAPLTSAQERLWFVDAAAPGNPTYNVPLLFRSPRPLDPAALGRALGAVTARHEPLRTVFRLRDGRPVQTVAPAAPVPVEVVRADGVPDADVRAEAERRGREPFDLATGPLLRCTLWTGAPGGDTVLLTVHHIAIDGWSLAPLFDDLATAYEAARDGRDPALPALPAAYADLAVRERRAAADPAFRRDLDRRVAELLGVPPGLALAGRATAAPAPEGSRPGRQYARAVPDAVRRGIGGLARSLRVTPYVVIGAAVQAVLHRWSGRTDFLLGTMTAGRAHADLEQAVGFFVNTVPLRCTVDPDASFAGLCAAARREAFRSLAHQAIPFDRLTAAATAARGQGQRPLVDIALVYQNTAAPRTGHLGWTPPEVLGTGTAKFDLLLIADETSEGLTITVEYDTDRYPAATAEAVADGVAELLGHALAAPDTPLRDLPALPGQPTADALPPAPELPASELPAPESSAPATPAPPTGPTAAGPRTEGERHAADLFATALTDREHSGRVVTPGALAPETNFFSLGGHSLLAVTMLAEARRRHGAAVSPRDFLSDPTVAGLGRLLTAAASAPTPTPPTPMPQAITDDSQHPATPPQQRFWFLDRLPSLRAAYLVPTIVEYSGPVDRDALRRAADLVLARHPALRSRFFLDRRKRQVRYSTDGTPAVTTVTDAPGRTPAQLRDHLARLCWAPMDLAGGTLARAEIIDTGDRVLFVLVVHHIVADGWSRDLLLAEIATAYRAFVTGRAPELRPPVHPAVLDGDREGRTGQDAAAQTAAMLDHLRGAPADIALPHDRPRGELQTTGADVRTVRLGGDLAARLRTVTGGTLGCTMFMTSAALLAVTLARRGGQRDLLLAFPWAGREAPGSADAVGMLVNTLVLRADLRDDPTWADLLGRVRESCMTSYRNAHVPLDALAAALHPDRDLSRPALTPVYLSSQTAPPVPEPLAPGITARHLPLDPLHVKYELELTVTESGEQDIELALAYTTGLFGEQTARGLLGDMVTAAADLVAAPHSHPLGRSTP